MVLGDIAAHFGSKLLASLFYPKHLPSMGHTLRQGTSVLMFSQLLALAALLCFVSGRQVTKGVREVVTLSCEYNISVNELDKARVYWQKDTQMVLSIIAGTVKVWKEYKNRTILDIPNKLSLVILTLRLSDRGTYTCVVQQSEKGMFKLQHLSSVTLFLTADFHTPIITDLGNTSTDIKRILCSTSGGFPKPHLSWVEDGEEINTAYLAVSQDPRTELFTVSSELHFNMTRNHSFQCLVKYGNTEVSKTFIWQKQQLQNAETRGNKFPVWMSFLIATSAIAVIALIVLACNRSASRWRETRRNEASLKIRTIYREAERPQAEECI